MFGKYSLAEVGALLADPSRVAMLTLLLDGSRHSAGELAMAANLSPQAASAHLAKLTNGGLLRGVRAGRLRLFELARPEVGEALESLSAVIHAGAVPMRSHRADAHLKFARTCYDHLAGRVAVYLASALVARSVILPRNGEYDVPPGGERWFAEQGIEVAELRSHRRNLARQCQDWTERAPHLGGSLGAAWLSRCLAAGWIARISGTRAVRITDRGNQALKNLLGHDILQHHPSFEQGAFRGYDRARFSFTPIR